MPAEEPGAGPDSPDPDDADASSGACGCIVAAAALIIIVATLYACAARGPSGSTCEAAWDDAARTGAVVQPEAYRATLSTCSTVEEWDEQNVSHGARLTPGAATIAELCRTLDVTSSLCTTAERETP